MSPGSYDASAIEVLEGLEAVRRRPGMYIGSTGPAGLHHLVWEVVDNAVDEAMAGHCTRIGVRLLADGGCEVSDDGRGIPTDPHPAHPGLSAAEVVLTVLHAGGKFGGSGYKVSGGLHGVGVSVVNALSRRLELEVDRDGRSHRAVWVDGGRPETPLEVTGATDRTGTTVRFWPDPEVFETTVFDTATIAERLRTTSWLNPGLVLELVDERDGTRHRWLSTEGITEAVTERVGDAGVLLGAPVRAGGVDGDVEVDVAFTWTDRWGAPDVVSFVNGIRTPEGGTHEEGFRKAVTTTVNRWARERGLLKDREDNFSGEDIREGMVAVVTVRFPEPQFEGQTKAKLGTTRVRAPVERVCAEALWDHLENHPGEARALVERFRTAARARLAAQRARVVVQRRSALDGVSLPGKLADCSDTDRDRCELFIVEGASAGGSAKEARNPAFQAILPIRGKILNVERATEARMWANSEIQALVAALGAGAGESFDPDAVRYGKVIIMCDADVDGAHIRVLLLTFFHRQMPGLLEAGRVYAARPPLYSTMRRGRKVYLLDDDARARWAAAHPGAEFTRLKGLGEMDAAELWATTMDPARRVLTRLTVSDAVAAADTVARLMGDDVDARRAFLAANARFADLDV